MNALNVLVLALAVVACNAQCPYSANKLSAGEMTFKIVSETTIVPVTSNLERERPRVPVLSSNEVSLIRSTLKQLKKSGNVAPKLFIRYFQIHPEVQRLFPTFATLPLTELPSNPAFLSSAYTCYSALHYYLLRSENVDPTTCTYMSKAVQKYSALDVQELNKLMLNIFEEELGSRFGTEAKSAMKKALDAMVTVFGKAN